MRDGQKVAECDIADHTKADGFWMTGKVLDIERVIVRAPKFGEDLFVVDVLSLKDAFANVLMRRGEIVGITGLLDSGRNELARAIAELLG
ncbi:hypothetical protein [Ensifer canadensis]